MDWQDDEFETFLQQFRPGTPKALPAHRRPALPLAAAAIVIAAVVIAAAVVIPMRYQSKGTAVEDSVVKDSVVKDSVVQESIVKDSAQTPASTPPANTNPSPAAVPDLTTLIPFRPAKERGVPSSGPVSTTSDSGTRRVKVDGSGRIRPPMKLLDVQPVYPEDAQAAGITGVVVIAGVIGVDGSVIETNVVRSIPELDQAAIDAVSQWLFEPTLLNGEPVEVEMYFSIQFTLQ